MPDNNEVREIGKDRVIWPSTKLKAKSYGLCEGLKNSIYGWPARKCDNLPKLEPGVTDNNHKNLKCVDSTLIVRSLTDGVACGNFSVEHGSEVRCEVLHDEPSDSSASVNEAVIEVYTV